MQASAHLRPICLKWAIQLGIPDIISNHDKPITLSELVSALQIPPAKGCFVHRFMRFLAHNGIFDIHEGQEDDHELITYALTPASKLLLSGTDHCLASMVLFTTSDPDMNSIVDVGGGTGTVARFINEAFPKLECNVFDLPEVVENLTGANNLSFVGGDMFKSIPQADAVIYTQGTNILLISFGK
uniref:Isoflavone-7-O-methyltransferase 8 n=1 Tax=Cajanus cajan TaxID=3821 RepID=A0A151U5J6_CAJCA|nr:Isoflavone-7-O-methyltransferase 8 [Cajanus cajan]